MNTLLFMKEAVDHFNLSLYKPTYDVRQGLYKLQAIYKDLQHQDGGLSPSFGVKELVKNEEFLRYCAARLNTACSPMNVNAIHLSPSTIFMAVHEYEHKHGEGLDNEGLSSLQRIALHWYIADFLKGKEHDDLMKRINELGEYLLVMDAEKEHANIEALSRIDAMRLVALMRCV